MEADTFSQVMLAMLNFSLWLGLLLALPLLVGGLGFLYYSLLEIRDARTLRYRVELLGNKKKIYGMDTEGA